MSQGMLARAVAVLVVVGTLSACAAAADDGEPTTPPSPAASPTTEFAPAGTSALPLGCADLLDVTDLIAVGPDSDEPISVAVDESRIEVGMRIAELQRGTLHCVWASRYGASDFHAQIDLTVAPAPATALDPATEDSHHGAYAALDGDAASLVACTDSFPADESAALYNGCDLVRLVGGYRIELGIMGLKAAAGRDTSIVVRLADMISAAIDEAGPARMIAPAQAGDDPASLCRAHEVAAVLAELAVSGDPSIDDGQTFEGVTTCVWERSDSWTSVYVIPGGAWAIEPLATGVATPFLPTHPSRDGSFIVGIGEGLSAWRAIGDDLVAIYSDDVDLRDDWEAFLESVW